MRIAGVGMPNTPRTVMPVKKRHCVPDPNWLDAVSIA
jgi:hypothetical protein